MSGHAELDVVTLVGIDWEVASRAQGCSGDLVGGFREHDRRRSPTVERGVYAKHYCLRFPPCFQRGLKMTCHGTTPETQGLTTVC